MGALLRGNEVAALAGITERSVNRKACEMLSVPADDPARNGRRPRLYDSESLPPKLREKLAVDSAAGLVLGLNVADGPNLSVEDQAEAERRYQMIEPALFPERFRDVWATHGNKRGAVVAAIATEHALNRATVYRWLEAWGNGGLPALVRRGRSDAGSSRVMTAAVLDFLASAALPRKGAYGAWSVREIYRAYEEERAWRASHANRPLPGEFERRKYGRYLDENSRLRPEAQMPEVSYETFRRWHSRIPEPLKVFSRGGLEALANTELLSFRDLASVRPLQYVVMDHRVLDLFCLVRDGARGWKLIRPWLTAAIDMRTRKWLAYAIVETPSSDSIAAVLKRVFIEHGLPEAVYFDRGRDYRCQWLEGPHKRSSQKGTGDLSDTWRGVLDSLGVRVHHAIVRRARSKLIEANFNSTSNFDRTLPWWCGHKSGERPERFEQLVRQHARWIKGEVSGPAFPTIEAIAEIYDQKLRALNEQPHTGEGMAKITPTGRGWMCPNEAWELLIGRVPRRSVSAEQLLFAFAKRKTLTVRNCEIRTTFGGRQYHFRPVGNPLGLEVLNGQEVEFAYDPLDLGMAAVYFENRFRGLVTNAELRQMGEDSFVEDERARRAGRRMVRQGVAAIHASTYVPDPVERLARRQAVLPERIEPQRAEVAVQVRPEIEAAAAAAAEEKAFKFSASANSTDIVRASEAAYRDDDPDDEFNFFSTGGNDE